MIQRGKLPMALLVGLAGLSVQACELPSGEHGKTTLKMSLSQGPIVIGDTLVLQPQVVDPEGRTVIDPPIEWKFPYIFGRDRGKAEILETAGDKATVVGLLPGSLRVEIRALQSDPWFTSDVTARDIPIRYTSLTVSLVGVGSDTVLDTRGDFDLRASAVDDNGNTVAGTFQAETQGRSVEFVEGTSDGVRMNAFGIGPDTVVVTHNGCPLPCADTVAVDVEPVAAGVAFSDSVYWAKSLGPFQSSAMAQDRNGYEVFGVPIVWHVADTSQVLSMVDSLGGTLLAQENGWAEVQAISGSFAATQRVVVQQAVTGFEVEVPPHVVGVGTRFLAKYRAFDANGVLVDSLVSLGTGWGSTNASIASVDGDSVQTNGYGKTAITLWLSEYLPLSPNTYWVVPTEEAPLFVIPEPDSVRAYPQSGNATLTGIGATATWLGDIYLPEVVYPLSTSTITGVPLFWTSLDAAVATIDVDGLVTAVSAGTARIVGTMGAAADTSVVTVTG